METKICKVCNESKLLNRFRKRKSGIYSPTCRKCYNTKWYSKNPKYQSEYDKKRWSEKKEIERDRNLNWRKSNYKRWYNERMKNDMLFASKIKIRWCIKSTFKKNGYTKKSKTYEILGIDYEGFKKYIESMFIEGMTWENHGDWHLDHIKPISTAKDENDLIKLNHFTNFQPLWALDNLLKGNKYESTNLERRQ